MTTLIKHRWLKYEEKVESGNRWSKPHVATTSLASLFALRMGIYKGDMVVVLDLEMTQGCVHSVAGKEVVVNTLHITFRIYITHSNYVISPRE